MKSFFAIFIIVFLSFTIKAQTGQKNEVTFCDLVDNPEKYAGKEVIVKATYQYGFELSAIYCLKCIEKKAWVELDDSFKKFSKSKYRKLIKENGDRGRTVNVVFSGTLLYGGGFGHLGIYPYGFIAKSIITGEIVADNGLNPHALSLEEQQKICRN